MNMGTCRWCGDPLTGYRSDAEYCGGPHRAEASRLRTLLDGKPVGEYRCVLDRVDAIGRSRRQSRTQKD